MKKAIYLIVFLYVLSPVISPVIAMSETDTSISINDDWEYIGMDEFNITVKTAFERYEPGETVGAYISFNSNAPQGKLEYFLIDVNNIIHKQTSIDYLPKEGKITKQIEIPKNALPGKWQFVVTFTFSSYSIVSQDYFYVDKENVRKWMIWVFIGAIILIICVLFIVFRRKPKKEKYINNPFLPY